MRHALVQRCGVLSYELCLCCVFEMFCFRYVFVVCLFCLFCVYSVLNCVTLCFVLYSNWTFIFVCYFGTAPTRSYAKLFLFDIANYILLSIFSNIRTYNIQLQSVFWLWCLPRWTSYTLLPSDNRQVTKLNVRCIFTGVLWFETLLMWYIAQNLVAMKNSINYFAFTKSSISKDWQQLLKYFWCIKLSSNNFTQIKSIFKIQIYLNIPGLKTSDMYVVYIHIYKETRATYVPV